MLAPSIKIRWALSVWLFPLSIVLSILVMLTAPIQGISEKAEASTGADVVAIATNELGNGGSKYRIAMWGSDNGYAWCQAFVTWCMIQAGAGDQILQKNGLCKDVANNFKQRSCWKDVGYSPKAGDIVYFHNTVGNSQNFTNHVGIVTGCSGGRVYTIEGNSKGMVKRNGGYPVDGTAIGDYRTKIVGYGIPNYGGSIHNPYGFLDTAVGGDGTIKVTGWAKDDDVSGAIQVHIYVNDECAGALTANVNRSDVGTHGFSGTIKTNKSGRLSVKAYGINVGSGSNVLLTNVLTASVTGDTEAPKITNVKIIDFSSEGYTVECTVTDNRGVSTVKFPSWTKNNGQDDLIWHTGYSAAGNRWRCKIATSDHNNAKGVYLTHIYAYDAAGNSTAAALSSDVLVPDALVFLGNTAYCLSEESIDFASAQKRSSNVYGGGHLATITSAEEQAAINQLVSKGKGSRYWIGMSQNSGGDWVWCTGEDMSYTNWNSAAPYSGSERTAGVAYQSDGTWANRSPSAASNLGFIREVEGFSETNGDVIDDLPEGTYTICSSTNSKYVLAVDKASVANKGNVILYQETGKSNQRFKFEKNDDGTYSIYNVNSGMAVEVYGGYIADNSNISQYERNGTAAQKWYVERCSDGTYSFRNKGTNKYIDIYRNAVQNSTNIQSWHQDGSAAEKFILKTAETPDVKSFTVSDITTSGYTVNVIFEDSEALPVTKVNLPTWTRSGDQDDIIWHAATISGNKATFRVKKTDHNNETGFYNTHVYLYDKFGSSYHLSGIGRYANGWIPVPDAVASYRDSTYLLLNNYSDTWGSSKDHLSALNSAEKYTERMLSIDSEGEQKFIESFIAAHGTRGRYWLNPAEDSDYSNWGTPTGTIGSATAIDAETGKWIAVTTGDNPTKCYSIIELIGEDRLGPEVSDIEVIDVDDSGFTVSFRASDPSGIEDVQLGTWIGEEAPTLDSANDKDGLVWTKPDYTDESGISSVRISVSESGQYQAFIYAKDAKGNEGGKAVTRIIAVPAATAIHGKNLYSVYDIPLSLGDAEEFADSQGGHLATITLAEEQAAVAALASNGASSRYFTALKKSSDDRWIWSNGESLTYQNWYEGAPYSNSEKIAGVICRSDGAWVNREASTADGLGFIVEIDNYTDAWDGFGDSEEDNLLTRTADVATTKVTKVGQEAEFTCSLANVTDTPEYYWQYSTEGNEFWAWTNFADQTSSTLKLAYTNETKDYLVRCIVVLPDGEWLIGGPKSFDFESTSTQEHQHIIGKVAAVEATCTTDGHAAYYSCASCSKMFSDAVATNEISASDVRINALGHDLIEERKNVHEATCDAAGSYDLVSLCTRCNTTISSLNVSAAALGHRWSDWSVATSPTCTTGGIEKRFCVNDSSHSESRTIQATGHDWISEPSAKPTCTQPGVSSSSTCSICGQTNAQATTIPATGHIPGESTIVNEIKETCSTNGSYQKVVTCTVCGEEMSRTSYISLASGHKWDEGAITKEATATENGTRTFTCQNDPSHTKTEIISATNATEIECEHSLVKIPAHAATCESEGNVAYYSCDLCSKLYVNASGTRETDLDSVTLSIDPDNHTGSTITKDVKEATCTAEGYTGNIYCVSCNKLLKSGTDIEKTAHVPTVDPASSPTCTVSGKTEGSHCEICGKVLIKQTDLNPKGHSFGNWMTIKIESCIDEGALIRICSACSMSETKSVSASGHAWGDSYTVDQQPTYVADGSKSIHCTKCDAVKNSQAIPAKTKTPLANCTATLSTAKYTYKGTIRQPTVTVKNPNGKTVSSSYLNISYSSGRKNVGTYTVKITAKSGNVPVSGSISLSFKINPKGTRLKSLAKGSKAIMVKWTKQSTQTTGYQIRYSLSSTMSSAKTVTIKGATAMSKKLTRLKPGKRYYVQIRTYKVVRGKTYVSDWSSKQSCKAA